MFVIRAHINLATKKQQKMKETRAFVNLDHDSGGYFFYSESPYMFRTKEDAVEYSRRFPKEGSYRLGDVWQVCEVSYNPLEEV